MCVCVRRLHERAPCRGFGRTSPTTTHSELRAGHRRVRLGCVSRVFGRTGHVGSVSLLHVALVADRAPGDSPRSGGCQVGPRAARQPPWQQRSSPQGNEEGRGPRGRAGPVWWDAAEDWYHLVAVSLLVNGVCVGRVELSSVAFGLTPLSPLARSPAHVFLVVSGLRERHAQAVPAFWRQ